MDQMFSTFDGSQFDMRSVFKMNDYKLETQNHLFKVYLSLALCVLAASGGAATAMYLRLTGEANILGMLGGIGMLFWIHSDQRKQDFQRRLGLLCGFGFFEGLSIAPLLSFAAFVDPSLIVTAFLGSVAVFSCFAASAVVAKRRSYLYLGGILGSAVTVMLVLSLMNLFFRSVTFYLVELYGGLLIFSGYVVFDTQMILEKAENGSNDVVGHAATLFVDFVAIFVRILIILLRNRGESRDNRSKKSRNRSQF